LTGRLLLVLFLWHIILLPLILLLFLASFLIFWLELRDRSLHYESAFWLFILSEVMIFGSLFACCFWYDTCHFVKLSDPIEIPLVGSVLLLGSSITVTGFHHLYEYRYSSVLLALTIILGLGFVVLQMVEMDEVYINLFNSAFHATRFCTVGLHFSHVLIGALGLFLVLVLGPISVGYYRSTLITLYWHFVDYIWLLVYTFIYVCFNSRLSVV